MIYLENVVRRQSKSCLLFDVMEFENTSDIPVERKVDEMSTLKEDDSPQQQINEQSLAEDLEKNRECKFD